MKNDLRFSYMFYQKLNRCEVKNSIWKKYNLHLQNEHNEAVSKSVWTSKHLVKPYQLNKNGGKNIKSNDSEPSLNIAEKILQSVNWTLILISNVVCFPVCL